MTTRALRKRDLNEAVGYRRHAAQKMSDPGLLREYEAVIARCRGEMFQHPLRIALAERWHGLRGAGPSRLASPMLRVQFDDAVGRWILKTVWRV